MTAGQAQAVPSTTTAAGNTMTGATQRDLSAELTRLRASNNSGPADRGVSVLGLLLGVAGLVIILICFLQSREYSSILNQMDALILSLFGVALTILGSTLYIRASLTRFLRYWLLRMVYEQRDLAQRPAQPPAGEE